MSRQYIVRIELPGGSGIFKTRPLSFSEAISSWKRASSINLIDATLYELTDKKERWIPYRELRKLQEQSKNPKKS